LGLPMAFSAFVGPPIVAEKSVFSTEIP